ncbi:uncharacterized protein E0L32_001845 [Thyridium curvatum]|uniref:Ceramide glucosyltransferase n=1 Tax=Thyridium curvatum TaxID=1093900 RepID=A0A507ATK3_9PEZI|nr:uncharacterized protein E0L32_001834 [Thyridium curvatum]XP_030989981.1 uncharacterized protein E0L32_001845 [Thyridium curvatum]TPX08259.1 hypothetical protein E0L32_001834 [Thyridium curvatum]TPX08270.1 hypothetical protein E0L32_001845 [Thyridium curvatum]
MSDLQASPPIVLGAAYICAVWACTVIGVQLVGISTLFRTCSSPPPRPISPSLDDAQVPHITIIRPVKGLEPGLYDCLASTFRQVYPRQKLSLRLCVASPDDPAIPTIKRVIADFPGLDSRLLIETEDPRLRGSHGALDHLGPNPKIRNISRAYREARGDLVWIVDCNVWVGRGVAGRMVDKLCGFGPRGQIHTPFKFVHQLPLVVDVDVPDHQPIPETRRPLSPDSDPDSGLRDGLRPGRGAGGRLEEMFMATTHAKFYSAINIVGVAPCVVGKSNMFRKSHLERLTDPAQNPILSPAEACRGRGLDFFSSIICEDHLIGDLLWRSSLPGFANHGLVYGDVAIQPMAGMSIAAYVARRVRWLRVRKWTVIAATLVEPGVESVLCCLYLAFAMTTIPWVHLHTGLPQTWAAMGALWLAALSVWMLADRCVYIRLHACRSVERDDFTPAFARGGQHRPFGCWLLAWLGRELLALPIWTWAVLLGATVNWRGEEFRVRTDMSVVRINAKQVDDSSRAVRSANGHAQSDRWGSKDRVD